MAKFKFVCSFSRILFVIYVPNLENQGKAQQMLLVFVADFFSTCLPAPCLLCRTVHFFASSDKAKSELGWKPQHNFLADVSALVEDYKALGRDKKDVDFAIDDKILAAVGSK